MESSSVFTVSDEEASKRLDLFLTEKVQGFTRSGIKNLIEKGLVTVNGRAVKAGYALRSNDRVSLELPPPAPLTVKPEDIPIEILYEDKDIIVVNKPAGLPVHPGAGRASGTLVNALVYRTKELSNTGGPLRPGVVHRLDMDTTGVLVVARNDQSHQSLARQFKDHTTVRRYQALAWGTFKDDEGTIDLAIGRDVSHRKKFSARTRKSRVAVTRYRVLKRYPQLTLLELTPETGRTHQLRVHLAAVNHPIVGDQVYGGRVTATALPKAVADRVKGIRRQLLHAGVLGIKHPSTGAYTEFSAPPPPDMEGLVKLLDETFK